MIIFFIPFSDQNGSRHHKCLEIIQELSQLGTHKCKKKSFLSWAFILFHSWNLNPLSWKVHCFVTGKILSTNISFRFFKYFHLISHLNNSYLKKCFWVVDHKVRMGLLYKLLSCLLIPPIMKLFNVITD